MPRMPTDFSKTPVQRVLDFNIYEPIEDPELRDQIWWDLCITCMCIDLEIAGTDWIMPDGLKDYYPETGDKFDIHKFIYLTGLIQMKY